MKNLVLAIVVLAALVAAGTEYDEYDYDFDAVNVADGFPLHRPTVAKCYKDAEFYELRQQFREIKPVRNITARGGGRRANYLDLGRLEDLGGDFSVSFAFKMLDGPEPGQVLFHAGSMDGSDQIEIRFGGARFGGGPKGPPKGQPKEGFEELQQFEELNQDKFQQKGVRGRPINPGSDTLRFRVTHDPEHGGWDRPVWISGSYDDRIYSNEWTHVVAVHDNGCKKFDSGLKLYINGHESYESSLEGERDNYNFAYLAPNKGKPTSRRNAFLGAGNEYRSPFPIVPMEADFTCVQVYDKAVSKAEIESLYKSANRYLQRGGHFINE